MQTKNGKTFFADEKEAYAKMLNDGISADNAMAAIRERRSKLIPSGKIEQEYLLRLRELANQGMTSKDAVKKVFQERREKQYQALPWYKKVGKSLFDAGVGAVSTATSGAANAYDWGQSIFTGEKSEAGEMADEIQNTTQRITGDSTSSQFGGLAGEAALFYASGGAAGTLGKTAAVTGGVLSKAPVIGKVAAPVVNTIGKTANVIGNGISKGVNKVIPKGSGLGATFGRNAIYGGAFEGAAEIFRNGSDAKMEDIVSSATMGAVAGGALGVGLEKGVFGYGKDLIKGNFRKAGKDFVDDVSGVGTEIKGFFDNKTQGIATKISNNANRFTKGDIEKFTKMTGETPGEWAINRGLTSVGDDAVEQAVKYYQASMKQADKGFESITGKFKDTGDDYMGTMLGDLVERYEKTAAGKEKLGEMTNLYKKYQNEGLTMPEINQVKREYQKNFKYSWVELGSEGALRSTNIQNGVREWQFKLAGENGFKNIAEINKNTQGWKAYADMLGKQVSGTQGNNPITLTDWVALSGGNPGNIGMFLGKQVGKLPIVKKGAMKLFGKQTKNPLVEAEVEGIAKTRNKFTNVTEDGTAYYTKSNGEIIEYKKRTSSPAEPEVHGTSSPIGADGRSTIGGNYNQKFGEVNFSNKKDRWAFQTETNMHLNPEYKRYTTILDEIQLGKREKGKLAIIPAEAWNDGKERPLEMITGIYEKIYKKHGPFSNEDFIATANEWDYIMKNIGGNEGHINIIKRIEGTNKGLLIGAKRQNGAFITTHFEPTKNIDDLLSREVKNGAEILNNKKNIKNVNQNLKSYTNRNLNAEKISQEEAEKIVRKYFKEDELSVRLAKNIVDNDGVEAFGRYYKKMIEFAKNPTKYAPEHEVLHAYLDMALGKKHRDLLLEQVQKVNNFKTKLDAEEFMADSFAEFVVGRREKSKLLTGKIEKIFEDLAYMFKKFFGQEDKVEALFRDLESIGKGKKKLGELKTGGNNRRFLRDDPKNLRALHSLTEEKLEKVREMGGMPMPSIAVTKKGVNFDEFGDITFVGKKSLVDPIYNKANKLYSSDAYTPRVPEGDLVLKKGKHIEKRIKQIAEEVGASAYEVEEYLKYGRTSYERYYPGIEKYKKEIKELFDKKIFKGHTPSGREKYVDYTPDNVIKEMKAQGKGNEAGGFHSGTFNQMIGKASKKLRYIEEARKISYSNRTEELTNKYDTLKKEYEELVDSIVDKNDVSIFDFGKTLSNNYNPKVSVWQRKINEEGIEIDLEDLKKISKILEEGNKLPKSYIEAKPERFIRFNEFAYVLAPEEKVGNVEALLKGTSLEGKVRGYKPGEKSKVLEDLAETDDSIKFLKKVGENKHGPMWEGPKGAEAEKLLLKEKKGQVIGAYNYKGMPVDLIRGGYNSETKNGMGFSKIVEKHPEVLGRIQNMLDNLPETFKDNKTIVLGNDYSIAVIKLELHGKSKTWVMTAYDKN